MSSAPSSAELLHVGGERTTGESIRNQNGETERKRWNISLLGCIYFFIFFAVTAVTAIANIVKSSLGPVGLDKMLVDDIGVRFLFNVHLLYKIYQLLDILAFKK